jgi:hypothetical protein
MQAHMGPEPTWVDVDDTPMFTQRVGARVHALLAGVSACTRAPPMRSRCAPATAPPHRARQATDLDAAAKRLKDRCQGLLTGAKKYRRGAQLLPHGRQLWLPMPTTSAASRVCAKPATPCYHAPVRPAASRPEHKRAACSHQPRRPA